MAKGGKDRRQARNRVYSTVAGLLIILVGVVALSAFLHVGHSRIDERVYTSPTRTLQHLAKAQQRFRTQDLDEDGAPNYAASLADLEAAQCITGRLAGGEVRGYLYAIVAGDLEDYAITAQPLEGGPQSLWLFMDRTGIIRAARGTPATVESEIYWHPVHGELWGSR